METFLIKAAQLIVALGFLVFIHELGHYIFARIFGIKVNRFYLFFNPYFSILKYFPDKGRIELIAWTKKIHDPADDKKIIGEEPKALLSIKVGKPRSPLNKKGKPSWRSTLYGIGWVPLGGYCDIDGMVDETKSADSLSADPKPWEFRTKPAYQRLLVMLGGVMFNFILAIFIYAGIAFYWGDKYIPMEKHIEGMDFVEPALAAGFQNGDLPLSYDGIAIDDSKSDYLINMLEARQVTVLRNHKDTVTIDLPENFIMKVNNEKWFMRPRVPVYIDRVVNGEPAEKAGMQEGDHIVAIGDIATPTFTELTPALLEYKDTPTTATIIRDGKEMTLNVTPNSNGKLGFQLRPITDIYDVVVVKYGLLQSVPKGIENGTTMLTTYVGSMKHLFSKEGAESLGGFGAIGDMFPNQWNWLSFWNITAFLSVALAFMNILPIPALDGGHVLFLLWEIVTRRKPSEKFLNYAQMVGMALLLLLLVYANGMDIFRAFFK